MGSLINTTTHDREQLIDLFEEFIRNKGIKVNERPVDAGTFFPGIQIKKGELFIDRKNLQYPGDLLHEAGHIAVVPSPERATLNDNVTVERPGSKGEELTVMLWTWAACHEMNVSPEIVFHKDGYKGDSEWIISNYREEQFMGLPLLVWMGLAKDQREENGFPKMIKWLRD